MTVMRSVFYIPGNNEKMISKAPETSADIITLDLEDSVPPAEKVMAREMVRENLKFAGSGYLPFLLPSPRAWDWLLSHRRDPRPLSFLFHSISRKTCWMSLNRQRTFFYQRSRQTQI